jgi:hypothetical protein
MRLYVQINVRWERRRTQSRAIVNLAAFTGVSLSPARLVGFAIPDGSVPAQAPGIPGADSPVFKMKEHDA